MLAPKHTSICRAFSSERFIRLLSLLKLYLLCQLASLPAGASVRASATADGEAYDYDLFTIGAGSGGVRASRFSSGTYGAKVAVCEMPLDLVASDTAGGVGGTCVLRGCVPKKLMVYASQYAEEFHDSVGYG